MYQKYTSMYNLVNYRGSAHVTTIQVKKNTAALQSRYHLTLLVVTITLTFIIILPILKIHSGGREKRARVVS